RRENQPPCIFRNSVGWYQPRLRCLLVNQSDRATAAVRKAPAQTQDPVAFYDRLAVTG
ncbi:uncharacterized protein METZ01_LOCUS432451, partial [marine metagenome]